MLDLLVYILVRCIFFSLNLLPLKLRIALLRLGFKVFLLLSKKYHRIALTNLKIAFPEAPESFYRETLDKMCESLARLIVDFARLPSIDRDWIESHVSIPLMQRYLEIKRENPNKGILLVTGHIGSFELQAFILPLIASPISFVVRNFQLPRVDRWWNSIRERNGNKSIARQGAFKEVLRCLNSGRDVALLFDQNVKRNHAIFVDWFGKPAATTRAIGLAAVRTKATVIVAGLVPDGSERYKMLAKERDFAALYEDQNLDDEEKILRITTILSSDYEDMIRQYPPGWFWLHRRWKTQQKPEDDGKYYRDEGIK